MQIYWLRNVTALGQHKQDRCLPPPQNIVQCMCLGHFICSLISSRNTMQVLQCMVYACGLAHLFACHCIAAPPTLPPPKNLPALPPSPQISGAWLMHVSSAGPDGSQSAHRRPAGRFYGIHGRSGSKPAGLAFSISAVLSVGPVMQVVAVSVACGMIHFWVHSKRLMTG